MKILPTGCGLAADWIRCKPFGYAAFAPCLVAKACWRLGMCTDWMRRGNGSPPAIRSRRACADRAATLAVDAETIKVARPAVRS